MNLGNDLGWKCEKKASKSTWTNTWGKTLTVKSFDVKEFEKMEWSNQTEYIAPVDHMLIRSEDEIVCQSVRDETWKICRWGLGYQSLEESVESVESFGIKQSQVPYHIFCWHAIPFS